MSETEVKISYATIRAAEKIQLRAQAEEDLLSTEELQRYIQEASDAENQRLRDALGRLQSILMDAPELNMGNYTDDQVRELNSAVINACNLVNDTLNPERGAE